MLRPGNYRLDAIQAAILRVKLARLDAWIRIRRTLAQRYDAALREAVRTPAVMPYADHAYHAYAVRAGDRDALRKGLTKAGVETAVHYPAPVHLQAGYADLAYGPGTFPQAERAASEVLSLPIHPHLSETRQQAVIAAVLQAAAGKLC